MVASATLRFLSNNRSDERHWVTCDESCLSTDARQEFDGDPLGTNCSCFHQWPLVVMRLKPFTSSIFSLTINTIVNYGVVLLPHTL